MQDIKEIKIEFGAKETGVSNMLDGKPMTIVDSNLIGVRVFISFEIQIHNI
jgi:hypothetical protein